jgi:hypothetical protein
MTPLNHSSPLEDISPASSADSLGAEYTVGVDLGQSFDPTAVAVVRKIHAGSDRPIFQVGHLEQLMPWAASASGTNADGGWIGLRRPSGLRSSRVASSHNVPGDLDYFLLAQPS